MTATPLLTERDFAILEAMLKRRRALGDPLAEVIERKLAEAKVVPASEIEGGIATLNSRVAFRVDSLAVEERTLVNHEGEGAVGLGLPIHTRRGLAILGMAEGATVVVERRDGGTETIVLEKFFISLKRPAATGVPPRARVLSSRWSTTQAMIVSPLARPEKSGRDGPTMTIQGRQPPDRPKGCIYESIGSWQRRYWRNLGLVSR